MANKFFVSTLVTAACLVAGAHAHEHGGDAPTPEEAQARCVTEVSAMSVAEGQDPSHAGAICECLVPQIGADPALIEEVETHGGLPGPGEASAELDAVVQGCLPT